VDADAAAPGLVEGLPARLGRHRLLARAVLDPRRDAPREPARGRMFGARGRLRREGDAAAPVLAEQEVE
jgi:hypothetical protein